MTRCNELSRRIAATLLADKQTMGADEEARARQLGNPVVRAVFEAQLAAGAVLVFGPPLSHVPTGPDAGRGMWVELRVSKRNRKDDLIDEDICIDAEAQTFVEAPRHT